MRLDFSVEYIALYLTVTFSDGRCQCLRTSRTCSLYHESGRLIGDARKTSSPAEFLRVCRSFRTRSTLNITSFKSDRDRLNRSSKTTNATASTTSKVATIVFQSQIPILVENTYELQ